MRKVFMILAACALAACGSIETGHVGVVKTLGKVSPDIYHPGFYFAPVASVDEYSAKEIEVLLKDMTPKAHDNLLLKDIDVSVYYRTNPLKISGLVTKYTGQSADGGHGIHLPAYGIVASVSKNVIRDEVSKRDSLQIHLQIEAMGAAILSEIQATLDKNDPDTFTITRVLVQKVLTDPTIEASIQQAVAFQKNLESKKVQVQIAEQDALVRVAEANGIAKAQGIINQTLTREYLQHESNEVMKRFADKGGATTIVLPANATPLINIGGK